MRLNFNIEYTEFTYVSVTLAASLVFIGMLFILAATVKILMTPLKHIRKDLIFVIFICMLLIGPLIVVQIWVYSSKTLTDLAELLTEIIFSVAIFVMYVYQKECLMFFTNKYVIETPNVLENLVKDQDHQKIMFQYQHPMENVKGIERLRLVELYVRYWYILSGRYVFWFCKKKKVKSYQLSRDISIKNNVYITLYLFSIPTLLTAIFVLDKTVGLDAISVGRFRLAGFLNLTALIITLLALPRLTSFSLSFIEVFSFFESNKQVFWVVFLRLINKLIGSALGAINPEISIYDKIETNIILGALIFSLFYCLFWMMTFARFNSKTLSLYEKAPQSVTLRLTVEEKLLKAQNINDTNDTSSSYSK